jgi:hypothetical protein
MTAHAKPIRHYSRSSTAEIMKAPVGEGHDLSRFMDCLLPRLENALIKRGLRF